MLRLVPMGDGRAVRVGIVVCVFGTGEPESECTRFAYHPGFIPDSFSLDLWRRCADTSVQCTDWPGQQIHDCS